MPYPARRTATRAKATRSGPDKLCDASNEGLKSDRQEVDDRLTDAVGAKCGGKQYGEALGGEDQRGLV